MFAVVVSTAIQAMLGQLGIELYFAAFLPAVFCASLFAGPPAGALVVAVAVPWVWWIFIPPAFEFESLGAADINAITMFLFLSLFLIFLADGCRAGVALLSAGAPTRERPGN
jgi:hypothetical protein